MSTPQIRACSTPTIPAHSDRILHEILASHSNLTKIENLGHNNTTEKLDDLSNKLLTNVVEVYNENVEYINEVAIKYFDNYCEDSIYGEVVALKKAGAFCHDLSQRILRVIEQFKLDQEMPKLTEIHPTVCPIIFKPTLRLSKNQQALAEAREREIAQIQKPAQQGIAITVTCSQVPSASTLGICCEPDWADKPIAFTQNAQGWCGHIPIDKQWKCVIIDNEQVVTWEDLLGNRQCDAQTQPFVLNVTF